MAEREETERPWARILPGACTGRSPTKPHCRKSDGHKGMCVYSTAIDNAINAMSRYSIYHKPYIN